MRKKPQKPFKDGYRKSRAGERWLPDGVGVDPAGGLTLKPALPPDSGPLIPTSVLLQRLHDEGPTARFTLGWLMGRLGKRFFGIIMLLLAVVAVAPGISIVAGFCS